MFRNKKITNKDIPTIMRLVAKAEGISLPKLTNVMMCESGLRHFKTNGEVLKGIVNNNDIGVCQINKTTWGKEAKRLRLDLENPIDNILMASFIIKNDKRSWDNWVCN